MAIKLKEVTKVVKCVLAIVAWAMLLSACEQAPTAKQSASADTQPDTPENQAKQPQDNPASEPASIGAVETQGDTQTANKEQTDPQKLLAEIKATISTEPAATNNLSVHYVVKKGQRVSGNPTLRARVGQRVTISIESDKDDELHMHGYDIHGHIHAGKTETIEFVADHAGRFDFELHDSHLDLGVLEVYPE